MTIISYARRINVKLANLYLVRQYLVLSGMHEMHPLINMYTACIIP